MTTAISANAPSEAASPSYLKELGKAILAQGAALRLVAFTAGLEALAVLVSPWVASRVIDTALPAAAHSTLAVYSILIVVASAHAALASWLHERTAVVVAHRIEVDCLQGVLQRHLASRYSDLSRVGYGDTNETLASASLVATSCIASGVRLVTLVLSGVFAFGMLLTHSLPLAAFALVLVAGVLLLCSLISLREAHALRDSLAASVDSQQMLHVLVSALPTLRASGATERLVARWAELVRVQVRQNVERANIGINRSLVAQAAQHLAQWVATAALVQAVLAAEVSLGTLLTASLLVSMLVRNAVGASEAVLAWVVLRPHWQRVDQLLRRARAGISRREVSPDQAASGADSGIRLDAVSFRYDAASRWILSNYTVAFPAGQRSVLRGPSGFGKSTLLRLIAGLEQPEAGRVSVFGLDPSAYSELVSYVPQHAPLLEASLASNLTTLSGATLERVHSIAALTGLDVMLARLPMGIETLVSAAGSNLSAGQRQLVLLTAAFASSAPVVLLDEAVSQLDAASEARIQWAQLLAGRTVVEVRH